MPGVEIVGVYADGGLLSPNPSPQGGMWAWCHVDALGGRIARASGIMLAYDPLREAPKAEGETWPIWPLPEVSGNAMELVAMILALEALPPFWSGNVYSDSEVTMARMFRGAPMGNVPREWIARAAEAIHKGGPYTPILLAGHPSRRDLAQGFRDKRAEGGGSRRYPVSEHNVWCDQACNAIKEAYLAGLTD